MQTPDPILSDQTIADLREQCTRKLRQAIAQRKTGAKWESNQFARAIERAVLKAVQEELREAQRFRAFKRRYGRAVLDKTFGQHAESAWEIQQQLNQIAQNALDQPAVQTAPRSTLRQLDLAKEYPDLDLDLKHIRYQGA